MDELALFRSTRDDSHELSERALASARTALTDRIEETPATSGIALPASTTTTRLRPSDVRSSYSRWFAPAIAVALTGVVVCVLVWVVALSGTNTRAPATVGASPTASDQVVFPGPASAQQLEAVADGSVTRGEYERSFDNYRNCLSDAGFEVVMKEPTGDLFDYAIPDAAVLSGADSRCYDAEFRQIDMMWQSTNADDPQAAALADGTVTESEYREGFARYRECMSDAGFPLVAVDETSTIIDYSFPSEAAANGDEGRCLRNEFGQLDVAWQIANEYESETQRALRGCLEAEGITPGKDVASVWQQVQDAGINYNKCISGNQPPTSG